jgi:hypothetical protein
MLSHCTALHHTTPHHTTRYYRTVHHTTRYYRTVHHSTRYYIIHGRSCVCSIVFMLFIMCCYVLAGRSTTLSCMCGPWQASASSPDSFVDFLCSITYICSLFRRDFIMPLWCVSPPRPCLCCCSVCARWNIPPSCAVTWRSSGQEVRIGVFELLCIV